MTPLLQLDSLDDRREVWRMLDELRPADRWRFVRWACGACPPARMAPVLTLTEADRDRTKRATMFDDEAGKGITNQCYGFLWMLVAQYGLSPDVLTATLADTVKGRFPLPR